MSHLKSLSSSEALVLFDRAVGDGENAYILCKKSATFPCNNIDETAR